MGNLHNIDRSYRLNHREVSLNSHSWVGDHWFALWRFVCVDIFSCTCNFWRYLVKYSCGSMYLLFQLCLFHVLCCFASTVDVNPRQLNCVRASEWCRGVLPSGYCKQTLRSLLYSEGEKAPLNSWWYSEVSWMSFLKYSSMKEQVSVDPKWPTHLVWTIACIMTVKWVLWWI